MEAFRSVCAAVAVAWVLTLCVSADPSQEEVWWSPHDELVAIGVDPTSALSLISSIQVMTSSVLSQILSQSDLPSVPLYRHKPPSFDNDEALPMDSDSSSQGPLPQDCAACACEAAGKSIDIAVEAVHRMCDNNTEHTDWDKKKICEMVKKANPDVVKGYITFESKPTVAGYAYCVAEKRCNVHDVYPSLFMPTLAALDYCHVLPGTDGTLPRPSAKTVPLDVDTDWMAMEESSDCRHCIQIVSRNVMENVFEMIIDRWCQHPATEVVAHLCHLVRSHQAFAGGYLLAAVTPWKFGYGYCSGIHVCGRSDAQPMWLPNDELYLPPESPANENGNQDISQGVAEAEEMDLETEGDDLIAVDNNEEEEGMLVDTSGDETVDPSFSEIVQIAAAAAVEGSTTNLRHSVNKIMVE